MIIDIISKYFPNKLQANLNNNFLQRINLLSLALIILSVFISVYSFYFFIANKIFLVGSDAFYYMSIADSLIKQGEFKDITTIPNTSVATPQNGIVIIHVVLSLLGLSNANHMIPIVIINYLLYLSGIYPLYKIARLIDVPKGLPLTLLISVYLSAWHIYRIKIKRKFRE